MNVLVLNAGSSSLKFRLFRIDGLCRLSESETVLANGETESPGAADARMTIAFGASAASIKRVIRAESVADATAEVVRAVLAGADSEMSGAIDAVGHRIVHGGPQFFGPVRIDDDVKAAIHDLAPLAPLHNAAGIAGIEAAAEILPGVPNVAVFDTAFHHQLPSVAAHYALPAELSERLHLRRYGFHGISYRYVSERLAIALEADSGSRSRTVLCHLGSGASVCALRDGKSIDTSMGFTPLEGLVMGSRSGDVDPGLVLYLLRSGYYTADQLDDLLNHRSGMLGLSGVSGDIRDLEKRTIAGDPAAELALECFAYRVRKYIGAYAAALGGLDTLGFTGGIGEHSAAMRSRICQGLAFLGLTLDGARNLSAQGHEPAAIDTGEQRRIWVVPTDEERQIAREVYSLLN